jgi:hypothetical protein
MKKNAVSLVAGLMVLSVMSSCFHHDHDISISISDDENEYEMKADYRRNQTRDVEVYLNEHLLNGAHIAISKDLVDKEITLDDKTTFYINSEPGNLYIKIDKTANPEESCERVRQVCEELKDVLADN